MICYTKKNWVLGTKIFYKILMSHKSSHVSNNPDSKIGQIFACGIQNQYIFAVESGILGFGIGNTAQGIRNPSNDCFSDKDSRIQHLGSGIHGVEARESKTALDSCT